METFVVPADTKEISFILAGNPLASNGDSLTLPQAADFRIEAPAGTARITAYDAPVAATSSDWPNRLAGVAAKANSLT